MGRRAKSITQKKLDVLVGQRIVEMRKLRWITQAALARQTGLSRQYLCSLEKGDWTCSPDVLASIASALRVTTNTLLQKK